MISDLDKTDFGMNMKSVEEEIGLRAAKYRDGKTFDSSIEDNSEYVRLNFYGRSILEFNDQNCALTK